MDSASGLDDSANSTCSVGTRTEWPDGVEEAGEHSDVASGLDDSAIPTLSDGNGDGNSEDDVLMREEEVGKELRKQMLEKEAREEKLVLRDIKASSLAGEASREEKFKKESREQKLVKEILEMMILKMEMLKKLKIKLLETK